MKDIDHLFGSDAVNYLSTDDKAKVHIGKTAANAQAPLLMHVGYKIRLPDHDFVVGDKHKITPSVYAVCEVLENGKVSYSGDTHIRLRSAKHEPSTVYTHAYDVRELFTTGAIKKKPILVLETDGACDQAPR